MVMRIPPFISLFFVMAAWTALDKSKVESRGLVKLFGAGLQAVEVTIEKEGTSIAYFYGCKNSVSVYKSLVKYGNPGGFLVD